MMKEDIKNILNISINAPSGSNSQPWRFEVEDHDICVLALPEKDHPVLNFRNRGTWIAIGALIENILIASKEFGYNAKIEPLFSNGNKDLIVKINLENSLTIKDSLFSSIKLRSTNRRPFINKNLDNKQKEDLLSVSREKRENILFVEESEMLKQVGEALGKNEIVMLENKLLHKLFFNEIVWTEEESRLRTGLYLKTMELKLPQQIALRVFKYWPVMNFFNKLGLSKSIAKDNAKSYSAAALMGTILVDNNDEDFVMAGRTMQRLWLKATQMGMGFHIITGVPFLWQGMSYGNDKIFSTRHIQLINEAYKKITAIFNIDNNKIPAVIFRVGYGDGPTATSSKKIPEIIFKS